MRCLCGICPWVNLRPTRHRLNPKSPIQSDVFIIPCVEASLRMRHRPQASSSLIHRIFQGFQVPAVRLLCTALLRVISPALTAKVVGHKLKARVYARQDFRGPANAVPNKQFQESLCRHLCRGFVGQRQKAEARTGPKRIPEEPGSYARAPPAL